MSIRCIVFAKTTAIGPSSRYRYVQYRQRLAAMGIDLVLRPLFGPFWFRLLRWPRPARMLAQLAYAPLRFVARLVDLLRVRPADVVIVEHQLFPYMPAWCETWLARRGLGFVLEFDDAIYLTFAHRRKLERLCGLARLVVVGNEHLAAFARPFARAVEISPTTVDLSRYPREPRAAADAGDAAPRQPLVVGWIGLPYNFDALTLLEQPLRDLAREFDLVLRIVSAGTPELAGVPIDVVPWTLAGEVDAIRSFDVGVMPLFDDEWSRGKCGLKILQSFAAFVPVVASPVGVNTTIVAHGSNGFLAVGADAWRTSLRTLLADAALRRDFGRAGRACVEARFDADREAPRIAHRIRQLAGAQTS